MAVQGIEAIIFDCFGVLYIDTKQSLVSVAPPEKRAELSDLFTGNNYGMFGREEYLERVAEIVGISAKEVAQYIAHEHRLNDELTTFIHERIKPEYAVGLLSNIGREWIDDFFTKHQLHELFDAVTLSGDEGIAKPHPAIYQLAAARLKVAPEKCIMIDDIAANCEGAQMAGMQALQFHSNEQLIEELASYNIS